MEGHRDGALDPLSSVSERVDRRYGPRVPRPAGWIRSVVALSLAAPVLLLAVAAVAAEAPTAEAVAEGETTIVTVTSFAYSPDPVQVTPGSSLRWRWQGEGRHSVTAADRSFDSDPDCENNVLLSENCRTQGDEDFIWTAPEVTERTEVAYHCKLHGESEGMSGTVVIVPAPTSSPSPTPRRSSSPAPSETSGSGDDGGGSDSSARDGGSGSGRDDRPRTGSAPRLGTQTAPSPSESGVTSPQVAAPADDPELEGFPSPAPIPSFSPSSEDLGDVAVGLPDDDDGRLRTILLGVAAVAVTGTAVAFGSLVLFGPRWR